MSRLGESYLKEIDPVLVSESQIGFLVVSDVDPCEAQEEGEDFAEAVGVLYLYNLATQLQIRGTFWSF